MLENGIKLYENALKNKYAIPQFNINNLEWTRYILEECQINHSPVILGVTEGAIKYMGGYNVVVSLVKSLLNDLKITIPVVIHLDHGSSVESCKTAIDSGFTSVMLDASMYSIEKNYDMVKQVVDYAHQKNVSVEAEVGVVGGVEDNIKKNIKYANVKDCLLLSKSGINTIAPALGSIHGIYYEKPCLNFEIMEEIKTKLMLPLVLHGGSGIPDSMIKKAIENGVLKINYNTDLQIAWASEIRKYIESNNKVYDPRKIIKSGEQSLKAIVKNKILLLESNTRY